MEDTNGSGWKSGYAEPILPNKINSKKQQPFGVPKYTFQTFTLQFFITQDVSSSEQV